jgi:hypothetical protein
MPTITTNNGLTGGGLRDGQYLIAQTHDKVEGTKYQGPMHQVGKVKDSGIFSQSQVNSVQGRRQIHHIQAHVVQRLLGEKVAGTSIVFLPSNAQKVGRHAQVPMRSITKRNC